MVLARTDRPMSRVVARAGAAGISPPRGPLPPWAPRSDPFPSERGRVRSPHFPIGNGAVKGRSW